jgi:hypothetical protein
MDPNAPTENTEDIVDTPNLPDFYGLLDYTERFLQNFPVNDINTLIEKTYKEREEAELSEFYSNSQDDTLFDINNLENLDKYDFENSRLDNFDNYDEDNHELSDYGDNFESSDNDDDFVTA